MGHLGGFRTKTILTAVLVIACFATPAHAAPDRVALVIGNGAYSFATRLPNPPNDAADMAQALRDIGFDVVEGRDLDRRAMEEKIRAFGDKLDAAKIALFFYAGHGLQVAGKNYLVPVDAKLQKPGDLGLDTIDVHLVLQQMEAQQRVNLVFLDACRDNPLARSFASTLGASRSAVVGQGLASIQSAVGTMIAFATEPDKVALDGKGRNSPFTAALLNHIREPGIDIAVMMRRVRNDVLAATVQRQVPWDHSSLTDAVVLVPHTGGQPAATIPKASAPITGRPADVAKPPSPTALPATATMRPSAPAPAQAPAVPQPSTADAAQAWAATKDTTSPAVLEDFIRQFSKTVYGSMARARLKELQSSSTKPRDKVAVAAPTSLPANSTTLPDAIHITEQSSRGSFSITIRKTGKNVYEGTWNVGLTSRFTVISFTNTAITIQRQDTPGQILGGNSGTYSGQRVGNARAEGSAIVIGTLGNTNVTWNASW